MTLSILIAFIVILVGIYGICRSKNIIKSIICLNIIQTASILLFLNFAHVTGDSIPILRPQAGIIVDPLPQALMITTIVIGASITALALMFSIKIFHYYGTLKWHELKAKDG